jgi:transcriptional regulator with XRE-family HTH domain
MKKDNFHHSESNPEWENTETVGSILKQTRERLGFSIEDIAKKTNLRMAFIKNIEKDDFEKLPAKIHINGFLSIYAQALGINSNDLLQRLRKQEMLNKDTPVQEITMISRELNYHKRKKWFVIGIPSVLIILLIILFIKLSFSTKGQVVSETPNKGKIILLNPNHSSATFKLSRGDEFSFQIDKKVFYYKLIDFNKQTIELQYKDNKESIYILTKELLKHDYNNNYEYNYSLIPGSITDSSLSLTVSLIKELRNQNQNAMATFLNNEASTLKNTSSLNQVVLTSKVAFPISIYVVNGSGEKEMTLNPYDKLEIPLLSSNQLIVDSLYVSDFSGIYFNINGVSVPNRFSNGTVGMITFRLMDNGREQPSLKYKLFY